MKNSATFAGRVRVWRDGYQWKWCPEDEPAPQGAKIADRYLEVLGDVIYPKHGDQEGEYIRGSVKAE